MLAKRPYNRLYVHVPFCRSTCGYCAFYSKAGVSTELQAAYLEKMIDDFRRVTPYCAPLKSIYIGGGTPGALGAERLGRLLEAIRRYFSLEEDCEWTCEMNPDPFEPELGDVLGAAGVCRVSIGIQTWSASLRRVLGRRAHPERLPELLDNLRNNGIARVGLDLIYGIPGQTLACWREDLRLSLPPPESHGKETPPAGSEVMANVGHLSTYALTMEEGTRLAMAGYEPTSVDLEIAMWENAEAEARRHGLYRYEVSNFARPGEECRHNLGIWHGDPYLGCGPAAAGFDGQQRARHPADLEAWLAGDPADVDRISPRARTAEILAFGLRTVQGWSVEDFAAVTGENLFDFRGKELEQLAEDGWLLLDGDTVRPTKRGLLCHDALAEFLLEDPLSY